MELFDVYPLFDITPVRGEGTYVFDNENKKYLDLYGGHAVISIGHSHPAYVNAISTQVRELGFYSNSVKNPLQVELSEKLGLLSGCKDYQLFLCNSGAEANENALKVASFTTKRERIIYFDNAFHGRTSGAVAVTDNPKIISPYNRSHKVTKLAYNDMEALAYELGKGDVAAVIFEVIQGVGGLDEAQTEFYKAIEVLAKDHGTMVIADEVQAGYGRTGDFFAFQKHGITPDIISVAKGMGNGFPIGGILIHPRIKPQYGMLGTTFGGNHLACAAGLSVLEVIENEGLIRNASDMFSYVQEKSREIPEIKNIKGRGLMLGLEFDFEIAELRKDLLYVHQIFTGAAANKKLLRILPPLNITKEQFETFFDALKLSLSNLKNN